MLSIIYNPIVFILLMLILLAIIIVDAGIVYCSDYISSCKILVSVTIAIISIILMIVLAVNINEKIATYSELDYDLESIEEELKANNINITYTTYTNMEEFDTITIYKDRFDKDIIVYYSKLDANKTRHKIDYEKYRR